MLVFPQTDIFKIYVPAPRPSLAKKQTPSIVMSFPASVDWVHCQNEDVRSVGSQGCGRKNHVLCVCKPVFERVMYPEACYGALMNSRAASSIARKDIYLTLCVIFLTIYLSLHNHQKKNRILRWVKNTSEPLYDCVGRSGETPNLKKLGANSK
jgi:hypothetical protein